MPAPPLDPRPGIEARMPAGAPPSPEKTARWHDEDRCWNCGSREHYKEGCPQPGGGS